MHQYLSPHGYSQDRPSCGRQVSSQGSSRAFIIKALTSVAEHVKGRILPSIFTFKREVVLEWLLRAKRECDSEPNFQELEQYYGGPHYCSDDGKYCTQEFPTSESLLT